MVLPADLLLCRLSGASGYYRKQHTMMDKQTEARLLEQLRTLPPDLIAGFPITLEGSQLVGRFFKCALYTEFRSNFYETTPATQAQLAVYGPDGLPLHEDKLYALPTGEEGVLRLDRLVRLLHALNHFIVRRRAETLIMNVHMLLLTYVKEGHGQPFAALLRHFGLEPQRVVLILPDCLLDMAEWPRILDAYKTQGFRVCAPELVGWDAALESNIVI